MVAHAPKLESRILNSWKEIAAYLNRGVRTVQRWERELNLPVHRIGKGKRSPVYANVAELDFWLRTIEAMRPSEPHSEPLPIRQNTDSPIQNLRLLRSAMRQLSRAVAENSVRQRQETAALKTRMLEMRERMKRKN